jgi:hypothetical protein
MTNDVTIANQAVLSVQTGQERAASERKEEK